MEDERRRIIEKIRDSRIYFQLRSVPENDRQKLQDIFDGKEVVIEHDIRYGKIVCHFIPTSAYEAIKAELQGRTSAEAAAYHCGLATREAHEKQVIKKMKSGADPNELIEDFVKRQKIEGSTFYGPVHDLAQPYYFSQELMRLLPGFFQQLVEKLDVSYISTHLDEYQTLDFIHPHVAETAIGLKKILTEDFLAKHSNEPELRRALKVKQGGSRKRKGFVWTSESKIAFYEKVNSLPKQNDRSAWQFTLDMLIDQEFDAETISWLRTHPALNGVPEIFNDAIKTWRKYLFDVRWNEMKPSEKPRAFEFRHALHLLDYPDEFTYSTLKTYYLRGKVLVENQKRI